MSNRALFKFICFKKVLQFEVAICVYWIYVKLFRSIITVDHQNIFHPENPSKKLVYTYYVAVLFAWQGIEQLLTA
jgi:hypothetical protein